MKEIFIKNRILFIVSFGILLIIIIMLNVVLKSSIEYKDIIEYGDFDKNSEDDYNKYNKRIDENHFDLQEKNNEVVVKYNEIKGFEQVNVVVNYNKKELTRFESFSPIVNVIKYNELYLIFTKEKVNNRESVIVIDKEGNKLGEIIASDERDIISFEDDRIINKKYTTTKEYMEVDKEKGKECGKKEIYILTDHEVLFENYEYIYCLID